jgi:EmrB/QacA subfamily drug resistance transporter
MSSIAGAVGPVDASGEAEALAALRSPTGVALIAATVLASGVGSYDAYVVNVAVPAISRDLNTSVTSIQWTLTGYLLAVAALLLLVGALADRFGRRRMLVIGLCGMLVSSVLCAVAPSIGTLIGARVLQGVAAALVVPTSLALLNGTLRVADRARGIGVWAGLTTLATTVGPYAGGWLVDHASWRWVFLLNLPLIGLALLALHRVPESGGPRRPLSLDILGAGLGVVGLGGLVYALTDGAGSGWTSARVLLAFAVGALCLAALLPVERRRRAPMLRLSLFASRQFDAINVATVFYYGALGGASYVMFLQFQLQLGYSAAQAGAALIPSSVVFVGISPLSGALVARLGPKWLMFSGILMVAASFFWLSRVDAGAAYAAEILPAVLLWGLGLGVSVAPLTAAVLAAVGDADLGEASAVNDATSRLGGLIVTAAIPALIGATGGVSLGEALADGYPTAMIALGAMSVAAAAVTALFVSNAGKAAPRIVAPAPHHACVLPDAGP